MKKLNVESIENKWVREDERTNAKWSIDVDKDNEGNVILSGEITITLDDRIITVKGACTTLNDEESVGRAMQSINDGILKKIQGM